jgi:hypothetical protein
MNFVPLPIVAVTEQALDALGITAQATKQQPRLTWLEQ